MSARPSLLALVFALSLAGCASRQVIVVSGVEVYENLWAETVAELRPRAQFELGCSTLEFALFQKARSLPSEVGVTGCGKRVTYVRAVSFSPPRRGPWSANFVSDKGQPAPAPDHPAGSEQPRPTPKQTLEFFNSLSGHLDVGLSEPAQPVSEHLLNRQAPPTAKLVSVTLSLSVFAGDDLRALTEAEYQAVAFAAPSISLRGVTGAVVVHRAPNGKHFTVRELARAVERTELETRGASEWLGGVDAHHVFFEGLREEKDGTWSIHWGS